MLYEDFEFLETDYLKAAYRSFYENWAIDAEQFTNVLSEYTRVWRELDSWYFREPSVIGYDFLDQPVNVYNTTNTEFETKVLEKLY